MVDRIFPRRVDNTYRGHWLATGLLVLVVLLRLVIGANSMLNPRSVAATADGIPLDHYGAAAADAVVALFALLGLGDFLLGLLGALVLLRYRAMIPLMFVLLLLDQLGRKVLVFAHPIARAGATTVATFSVGTLINYGLLAMLVVGFGLSLMNWPLAQPSS